MANPTGTAPRAPGEAASALTDNERQRYEQKYPEGSAMVVGRVQQARDEGMERGIQKAREGLY